MRASFRVGMIVLIATSAAGCAAGGYDPGALERRMESAGVPATAAKCVVDEMTQRFGDPRLSARADPSGDELKAERALLRKCGVKTR